MTTLINLTPHALRLRINLANTAAAADAGDVIVEPCGQVARVAMTPGSLEGSLNGVALYGATTCGPVEGLPAPQEGVVYIVSALVGAQVTGRDDVVQPGTGPKDGVVRTGKGEIFAVTRLVRAC